MQLFPNNLDFLFLFFYEFYYSFIEFDIGLVTHTYISVCRHYSAQQSYAGFFSISISGFDGS